ncbi:MAG: putative metallopeptidase [Candidatus Limnocylindrales bacterium]
MALPLDPDTGLFPELIEPPFIRADELETLCDTVRDEFPEFRTLVDAGEDGGLVLGYVFETKPFDALREEFKPHTIAKVSKASPLWKSWTGLDAIVSFRRHFWTAFTAEQRRAVCYHELRHLDPAQDDDGHWKLSLREHDLEEFAGVMRRFGPIIPGRKPFLDAAMAWMAEQDRPEPTPLRPVEEVATEGVKRLVGKVMAPGSGVESITFSAGGRSATIDRAAADRLRRVERP